MPSFRAQRTSIFGAVLTLGLTLSRPREARAAEDDQTEVETADGVSDCRAFDAKNERELEAWEKEQPPVVYRYPREKKFLNAPWANLFDHLGYSGELFLASILPHLGAQFRGNAPAAHVSWPWSIFVFGAPTSCSRKRGTFVVHGHLPHRVLLEPAIVSGTKGIGFSVRPGYRFILHPTSWVVGAGLGLGSTVEIKGIREPFRFSVSPEAVLRFGHCCRPSYFTLAVRYDHFFKGNVRDVIGANLGYTFF